MMHRRVPHKSPRRWMTRLLSAAVAVALASPAAARCVDEESLSAFTAAETTPRDAPEPRVQLQSMVREALERSHSVGASKLLAEAALQDIEETKAGKAVQASVGGGFGPGGSRTAGVTETAAAQLRATLSVSQLLYDGGRIDRLTDWRTQLAESARYGSLSQREQLALNTVSLALERSRFRMQARACRSFVVGISVAPRPT